MKNLYSVFNITLLIMRHVKLSDILLGKLQMLSKETSESHVRLRVNNNNNRMFNYNCLHIKNTLR